MKAARAIARGEGATFQFNFPSATENAFASGEHIVAPFRLYSHTFDGQRQTTDVATLSGLALFAVGMAVLRRLREHLGEQQLPIADKALATRVKDWYTGLPEWDRLKFEARNVEKNPATEAASAACFARAAERNPIIALLPIQYSQDDKSKSGSRRRLFKTMLGIWFGEAPVAKLPMTTRVDIMLDGRQTIFEYAIERAIVAVDGFSALLNSARDDATTAAAGDDGAA